jgi:multidrug efflux pump subunit AcrB
MSTAGANLDGQHTPNTFNASAWALTHKPFVVFLMVLLTVAGISAYRSLGRDEDPPFTIKTMIVKAYWPGADAESTAKQLTDRMEKALEPVQWLDYVSSNTIAGETTLFVNLLDTAPPSAVPDQWYQVRKRIGDIAHTLPEGTVGPFFNDDFGDVYGVIYALTSDGFSYRELRDRAELIRSELLRVPGAGRVDLIGVQDEVLNIDFSTRKMAGLGISADQIASILRSQNAVTASGVVQTATERIAVRVSGALDSVTALKNVTIRVGDRQVRLEDLAEVTRGYADPPGPQFHFNGKPAIGIGVAMKKGGNILDLGKALHDRMALIQADLPAGIDVHLVANQPSVVDQSVGEFTDALFEAIVIVLLVSFVSLGIRAGAVVAISIPMVLAITFVAMQIMDISLQRISLGALVIALGLLVDDAMIAVEMMVKKLEEGSTRFVAATFAYTSTAFPMLTGTLVSVAGFLPVGFAHSAAGEYCFTLFAVVAVALLVSWFVAVLFTPCIGVALLKEQVSAPAAHGDRPHGAHGTASEGRMTATFRRVLLTSLRHRKLVIGITAAAFAVSVVLFGLVQQQFFPASDRPELLIDLRLAQNASISATEAEVKRFEKVLAADPDILYHTFYVGSGAVRFYLPLNVQLETDNFAQAVVVTRSYEVREQVRQRLTRKLEEEFGSLMARVQPLALGPPIDWPIQYRVSGSNVTEVRRIAGLVADTVRGNAHTRLVNFDWNELSKAVRIEVDQDKARQLGLSSQQVADAINTTLSGRTVTHLRDDTYLIEVRGRGQARDRSDLKSLRDLEIGTSVGTVPLAQLARFDYGLEESTLWRRKRLPTITVQADVVPGLQAATVIGELQKAIGAVRAGLPPGYSIEVGGTVGESAKGQNSILAVVPVMALVMLLILMMQLHSTQKLLLVLLTAPLGLIGVSLALLVSQRPFGFVAMLGVFALTGMIIRNSVVLMAQIKENEEAGMAPGAAIVEATLHRLRPILLTAAAAIFGLIPIAGEVFWGPMAFAMMGGLLVATVLTLVFLPALYAVWYRIPINTTSLETPACVPSSQLS